MSKKNIDKYKIIYECFLSKFVKTNKKTVFFISFEGQYNDNPKYISEELYRRAADVDIIWCVSKKGNDAPPSYAKTVEYQSKEYYRLLKRATVVVDNYTGASSLGFFSRFSSFLKWLAFSKYQLCISTWHGTPLKKIGKDTLNFVPAGYATSSTYCIAGCRYTADCLEKAYYLNEKIRLYGTPRNDIFFKKLNISEIKKKLCLPDKKLVLYAPTFRDEVDWSGIAQLKMMNIKKLLQTLKIKYNKEFAFIFRVHHTVLDRVRKERLLNFDEDFIINGNLGDDMAEYLACIDVLITDYSGSLFDFALTNKACFLFSPDRKCFEKNKGFFMRYDDVPYPIAEDFESLINNILEYDKDIQENKRKEFLSYIGNIEDGKASERIVKDIIAFLN